MDSAVLVRLVLGESLTPILGDCFGEVCIEFGILFRLGIPIFKGLSPTLYGELFKNPEVSLVGKLLTGT